MEKHYHISRKSVDRETFADALERMANLAKELEREKGLGGFTSTDSILSEFGIEFEEVDW